MVFEISILLSILRSFYRAGRIDSWFNGVVETISSLVIL